MTKLNDLEMTTVDVVMAMSEGTPGAIRVCVELIKSDKFMTVLMLDLTGVYSHRIWMLYKDVCGEDLAMLCAVVDEVRKGNIGKMQLIHAIENHGNGIVLPVLETA